MRITTIADLGMMLPVGVEVDGQAGRSRELAFKGWDTTDEIAIGAIRDRNRAMGHGGFATEVLAHFLAKWGAHDFSVLKPAERILILKRSWAADFYFAWFQLRREVLGNDLDLSLTCPLCRFKFPYTVDLSTVEVFVIDDDEVVEWPLSLRDGIDYAGASRKLVTMAPLRWHVHESSVKTSDGALNVGAIKLDVIRGSIVGVDGSADRIVLPPSVKISKYDIEAISNEIQEQQPGPDLSIEPACPECGTTFPRTITWIYDSFFSVEASSRGRPATRPGRSSLRSRTTSPGSPSISAEQRPPTENGG
jgi:hypothetical protein